MWRRRIANRFVFSERYYTKRAISPFSGSCWERWIDTADGAPALDPDFIHDLFAPFGPVIIRRMFSGAGIFRDGLMFGLIVRDVIYLKADESSTGDFEREGCGPFTYVRGKKSGRPKQHALPFWRLPERLYDEPDELADWARKAFEAAQRKKLAAQKRSKRKPAKRT
jgi:DNA transformation protein and related proteins